MALTYADGPSLAGTHCGAYSCSFAGAFRRTHAYRFTGTYGVAKTYGHA
jgi:hypothetical protein